ncbi:MAG: large-conductance mechanosensitive channel protein MscL [Bacteroidetes bacterium]|nr:large-conductance mechanosensitive channel protein MscL [Bacteroidota bacterium]
MGFISEFKTFAMRGNVLDMAVGIIIGGAFGKIVSSFVADVIMPPIGLLVGGVDFSDIKLTLKEAVMNGSEVTTPAVTMNIGLFLNTVIDFTIVAFAIFLLIKGVNNLARKKAEEPAAPPAPPAPSKEELLLTEIRDILKNK